MLLEKNFRVYLSQFLRLVEVLRRRVRETLQQDTLNKRYDSGYIARRAWTRGSHAKNRVFAYINRIEQSGTWVRIASGELVRYNGYRLIS